MGKRTQQRRVEEAAAQRSSQAAPLAVDQDMLSEALPKWLALKPIRDMSPEERAAALNALAKRLPNG